MEFFFNGAIEIQFLSFVILCLPSSEKSVMLQLNSD